MTPLKPLLLVTPIAAAGLEPGSAQWLAMLHGIFGRGRNWQSIARELAAHRPDWGSVLVDLRLHGGSQNFPAPHTLATAAEDVRITVEELTKAGTPIGAVLGHSFGGKVALALAEPLAASLAQIWVIDSTPEARVPGGSAWDMLQHVRALPASFATRAEAVAALQARGWPTDVAAWMATNLRVSAPPAREPANDAPASARRFHWALDFDGMEALLRSFFDADLWRVVEHPPGRLEIHFVKGEESHALSEESCARILRARDANGRVHLHRVAGGHWLNAENPQAIIALLAENLPQPPRAGGGAPE